MTITDTNTDTNTTMDRRAWLRAGVGALATAVLAPSLLASTAAADIVTPPMTVYKDPSCGCCTKWVAHLKANGWTPTVRDRSDMDVLKDSLGVPQDLRSCHTAVVGRFVIEGHVPAADVKRLLATAPKGVLGLAVPGMPANSPGMEVAGRGDRYQVMSFGAGSPRVFATHG